MTVSQHAGSQTSVRRGRCKPTRRGAGSHRKTLVRKTEQGCMSFLATKRSYYLLKANPTKSELREPKLRKIHRGWSNASASNINVFRPPDHRSRDVSVKLCQLAISHFNLRFRMYCTFAALPE